MNERLINDLEARLGTAIHQLNYWRSEFNNAGARVAKLEAALDLCNDALNDERIGTTRHDDPEWYAKVDKARAALKDAPGG